MPHSSSRFGSPQRRKGSTLTERLQTLAPAVAVVLAALIVGYVIYSQMLRITENTAERLISRADSAFQTVTPLSATEKSNLRQFPNDEHVARARALGIERLRDRDAAADLTSQPPEESTLRAIETNDYFIMDPDMSYGIPYLTDDAYHLLKLIGIRFQNTLEERGLPPYRFLITSTLRTRADQAALRGVNINAAPGASSHEFGTTADIHYGRFNYSLANDSLPDAFGIYDKMLIRRVSSAYDRLAEEYDQQLKALLGRVLLKLQSEDKVMVTYERRQPVYHFTVAGEIEAPLLTDATATDSSATDSSATDSSAAATP